MNDSTNSKNVNRTGTNVSNFNNVRKQSTSEQTREGNVELNIVESESNLHLKELDETGKNRSSVEAPVSLMRHELSKLEVTIGDA